MGRYVALGLFLILLIFLGYGLTLNPREVPSPLIGKPAPAFRLPTVADPAKSMGTDDFAGKVTLLNVWASWCVSCRQEHPLLVELARKGSVQVYGLNYKDTRQDARRWLASFGDPYVASAFDEDGRVGIEWGVYGVPETFVIGRDGTIRYKFIGPIMPDTLQSQLMPEIEKALAK